MAARVGKNCKVTLGSAQVLGIGTWKLSGISLDELDDTEFGATWKSFQFGLKDGGQISFDGFARPEDTTGQEILRTANLEATNITTLRLYLDATSYFVPCQTTGYFSPTNTTGAGTRASYVNITSYDISVDKSGLASISFTAKVSGVMALV
jgi:hypothetical protein